MSKPTFLRLVAFAASELSDTRHTLRRRIDCLRHGHEPLRDWDGKRICGHCKLWLTKGSSHAKRR